MVELEGIIESIVYKNDENAYTVAKLRNGKELTAIVGFIPFLSEGQRVKIQGEWMIHPTFGQQIKVETCEEVLPSTLEGVERYLASGLIQGVGPVTAKNIVKKFGADSLDIIEMNPMRLTEVEGIGEKKAAAISETFKGQRELREVMVFLQSYGISVSYGIKIYKIYGLNTIPFIKENPYRLCEDISGIGFKTADKIAKNLGVNPESQDRIKSGIKYVLSACSANGHTYLPRESLVYECIRLLGVDENLVSEALALAAVSKEVVVENIDDIKAVYLPPFYFAELGGAKRIIEISMQGVTENIGCIDKDIEEYEKENSIEFAEEQRQAIQEGVKNGCCIITGGPGTGKTTIIKCMIKIFEKMGLSVVLAAPTGRAAKRITETTGYEAKTIHRLLEMEFISSDDYPSFTKDESDPIEADVIIIDEASMIDIILLNSLLKAIAPHTKLIMVGDVDQLPSVGPGNVLRDIIKSKVVGVARLSRIFRQADESLIAYNAHRINNGEMPVLNEREKDFFFISNNNPVEIVDDIVELVKTRLPLFKGGYDPIRDMQVLTPTRKGETGVYNLNKKLQQRLNPPSEDKVEKEMRDSLFRVGDKIMQIKNNYNLEWTRIGGQGEDSGLGVFNGDIGYISDIDSEGRNLTVIYDDEKRVTYDFTNLDEIELAYAVTVHKSQGSEFKVVVIPVFSGPPMLMTRNLIYTAVTRAKELVVLVGNRQALYAMINNNIITERFSSLKNRIQNYLKIID